MNRRTTSRSHTAARRRRERQYQVGYGKPPVKTRFQPGRSGNPRGRPKGTHKSPYPALNNEKLKSIVLDEAYRTISVNDTNGPITIPMAQAVIRSMAVNAAKGNQRAQRLFTQLLTAVERDNKQLHDQWLETAINYKVEWERELVRRKRLGIVAPDPVPHPDHVDIDMHTGTVRITGPMTNEEKVVWDLVHSGETESEEQIAEIEKLITSRPGMEIAKRLGLPRQDLAETQITRIERIIVDPKKSNLDDK